MLIGYLYIPPESSNKQSKKNLPYLLTLVLCETLCAELIWSERSDTWNHSPAWAPIRDLAGRAERVKRTDQLRDPKHFRALLSLTKTWGLDKVERYQWRTAGRPLVEELRRLAERCPKWSEAIKALNAAMLARHIEETETDGQSGRSIGGFQGNDKIKDDSCPISKPDIMQAIRWCEDGLVVDDFREGRARKRWRRDYALLPPEPDKSKLLAGNVLQWTHFDGPFQSPPLADAPAIAVNAERRSRLVGLDEHGLLVQMSVWLTNGRVRKARHDSKHRP